MAVSILSSLPAVPLILSAVVLVLLIAVFILCVCHGHKEKAPDFGIPGRLSSITVDVPPMQLEPSESEETLPARHEENHDSKYKTVVERALPDIPKAILPGGGDTDTDQTPDSGSECYATVNKPSATERNLSYNTQDSSNGNHESSLASTSASPASGSLPSPDRVTLRAKDASTIPGPTQSSHEYAHVQKPHHPYARLSNQLDSDPGTDDYDESQSSGQERRFRGTPNHSNGGLGDTNGANSIDQPKSDKDLSSPSSSSAGPSVEEPRQVPLIAGQAVAGNIPSAEIPYMTPPLAEVAATVPQFSQNTNSQEVPYTVISVREPLQRVRMQIQKLKKKQHSNQGSSLDEPEGYYMEVPDDEQTYAEIESGQNSGESSTTYDHIEPRNTLMPPDPPTVESLKSVAQAHSRQASIASMSSFGSNGEGQSSKDLSTLYSVVDKSNKKLQSSPESVTKSEKPDSNVNDLYAKVQKKKTQGGTLSVSGIEDVLRNETLGSDDVFVPVRGSWSPAKSFVESPPIPPTVNGRHLASGTNLEPPTTRTLARRHSAEPSFSGKELSDEAEPGYATVKLESSKPNGATNDPNYERIRKEIAESDGDPGYELIRNRSVRSAKEESDPEYEIVGNLLPNQDNLSEPGYERVKHLGRTDSDCVDPGYERVRRAQRRDTDPPDPDYECIKYLQRNDSDCVDPGYERVKRVGRNDSDAIDPGYEPIKRLVKSENGEKRVSAFAKRVSAEAMASSIHHRLTYNETPLEPQNGTSGLENAQQTFNEDQAMETTGFVISGERISIRINGQTAATTQVRLSQQSSKESNHTTNLVVGEPSVHLNSTEFKMIDNGVDDILSESQSNLDYETASSGESTLSSRNGGVRSSKHSGKGYSRSTGSQDGSRSTNANDERVETKENHHSMINNNLN